MSEEELFFVFIRHTNILMKAYFNTLSIKILAKDGFRYTVKGSNNIPTLIKTHPNILNVIPVRPLNSALSLSSE